VAPLVLSPNVILWETFIGPR